MTGLLELMVQAIIIITPLAVAVGCVKALLEHSPAKPPKYERGRMRW